MPGDPNFSGQMINIGDHVRDFPLNGHSATRTDFWAPVLGSNCEELWKAVAQFSLDSPTWESEGPTEISDPHGSLRGAANNSETSGHGAADAQVDGLGLGLEHTLSDCKTRGRSPDGISQEG